MSVLAGCEASSAPGGGAGLMVPGRAYEVTHSAGYAARLKFTEDGRLMVWQDGDWVADGQQWFRRDGQLCMYGAIGGPDYATCAQEMPTGNGGFSLEGDGNVLRFRPTSG